MGEELVATYLIISTVFIIIATVIVVFVKKATDRR